MLGQASTLLLRLGRVSWFLESCGHFLKSELELQVFCYYAWQDLIIKANLVSNLQSYCLSFPSVVNILKPGKMF